MSGGHSQASVKGTLVLFKRTLILTSSLPNPSLLNANTLGIWNATHRFERDTGLHTMTFLVSPINGKHRLSLEPSILERLSCFRYTA